MQDIDFDFRELNDNDGTNRCRCRLQYKQDWRLFSFRGPLNESLEI